MNTKELLNQTVEKLIQGDQDAAKQAYHQYIQQKSKELLREDHDYLLTEKGIETFLNTLHRRAKKEDKEDEFFKCLEKHTHKENIDKSKFKECAKHFSEHKKQADKFIHDVENKLKLIKDDPAKDIRYTESGDK